MELYFNPISTYSHKAIMAFHEKGLSYTPKLTQFGDPAFREINPLGKVPSLKTPEEVITESTNIIEWLDIRYQTPKLIPTKAEDARIVRFIDRQVDLYLIDNNVALFFQSLKKDSEKDQSKIETAQRQRGVVLTGLENRLNHGGEFIHGDAFSMADISLMCALSAIPLQDYPQLAQYFERHRQRPSLVAAREGFEEEVKRWMEHASG